MFNYLRSVYLILKKDWLIAAPAIIFYLVVVVLLKGRDPQVLMEDKDLLMVLGAISTVVVVFLQLFVAEASLQLVKKDKINFSKAVVETLKRYLRTLLMYVVLVTPLDALALLTANIEVAGTIVMFLRILLYLAIAPAIVLNTTLKASLKAIFSIFHFRKVFEVLGFVSFVLLIAIFAIVAISAVKIVFFLPFALGIITTYLNMTMFFYLHQNKGKVC